jgi:FkbM family methyltransferase
MERQQQTWQLENGLTITANTVYDYYDLYEPITTFAFMNSISKYDQTIIDIGSQFGHFALHAALKLKDSTSVNRIIAFEPVHQNAQQLRHNIGINFVNNLAPIEVFEEAIGSKNGTVELFYYKYSDSHGMYQHPTGEVESKITVPITTLDSFIKRENVDPHEVSLIKMDIEGNELNALRGMTKFLDKSSENLTLITELSPLLLNQAHESILEYIRMLSWYFKDITVIDEKEHKLKRLSDEWITFKDNGSDRYCNLWCIK